MKDLENQCSDYESVARAIAYIHDNALSQPDLGEIARQFNTSEYQFQKTFSRWAGVSPKRFLQYLTKEHVKSVLASGSVEDAAFATGLSTKSRVYDLMVSCEAMTPGEYQRQGQYLEVRYGFHPTPFGKCLIAVTARGICKLAFIDANESAVTEEFEEEWQLSVRSRDQQGTAPIIRQIFCLAQPAKPLHLLLRGTNFQLKVWEALLRLPCGGLTTYESLAEDIGNPKSVRAVGSAVGKNPVAFLIPCHRVISKTGNIHHYRWGPQRKQALIGREQARQRSG